MSSIVFVMALIAASPEFEVQTLDGKSVSGSLAELSAERAGIDTRDGRMTIEVANLLSMTAKQRPPSGPTDVVVELIDGSTLYARQCVTSGSVARITLPDGTVLETTTGSLRAIRLQPPSEATDAEWARLMKANAESDLLVVRKGNSLDYHKGVIHDLVEQSVQFDLDGEMLPVKRSKIYGLVYRHGGESQLPAAVFRITDAAGSQWSVRSFVLSDTLRWTTPAGLTVSQPLESIAQVDFSGGKLVYLSDLKPRRAGWTPYFSTGAVPSIIEQFYAPRYDGAFDGRPLRLGGTEYRKGLALHGRTELVYRLPEQFGRLQAVAGIDDTVRPHGKVRLVIRGDDKELLNTVITGRDAPRAINLELGGAQRLTVIVDFAESFAAGDHLLLCNARLVK